MSESKEEAGSGSQVVVDEREAGSISSKEISAHVNNTVIVGTASQGTEDVRSNDGVPLALSKVNRHDMIAQLEASAAKVSESSFKSNT